MYFHFTGGYTSYCGKCKQFKKITEGTFFEKTQIQFEDFFVILFMWASNLSVKGVVNLTQNSKVLVVQYFRYFRDVCSWKLLNSPPKQIGGVGHIVEIDESAVSKRKYNRGKRVGRGGKTVWVLGMYDKEEKEGVILHVEERDKCTMLPEIQRHVKWGTTIWTDQWAAYNGLDNIGFIHETVNHSNEFKSKTGVCTNGVEGYWRTLKGYCRGKGVMSSKFLFEYVDEFMWSAQYSKDSLSKFRNMIQHIKEHYPV